MTDASGRVDTDFIFHFDEDSSVYSSCYTIFKNDFLVFGGRFDFTKQISKIDGCGLRRIGSLDFDLYDGSCTVIKDSVVYLCFDRSGASSDQRKCRFATNPLSEFSEASLSSHDHICASVASSESKYHHLHSNLNFNFS